MTIGQRIKKLRLEHNLTQDELAVKLGMHGRQLSRYEINATIPSLLAIKKIADHFECSIDYLVYGENKELAKRTKINDKECLEIFEKINKMPDSERGQILWTLKKLVDC